MTSTPPNPRLVKTNTATASIAASTAARVSNLVPGIPSAESPVTVFQAGTTGVGAQLSAPTSVFPAGTGYYGVWTAPDLNNGLDYTVQVETFGGGGGGGGGGSDCGGGGGGGAEYAVEPSYPVSPFSSYAWVVGSPGSPGSANSDNNQAATAGGTGGTTQFDIAGVGVAGGVVAYGGQGGDVGNTGNGGAFGFGSVNTLAFPGGTGGTNIPGSGGSGSGGQGGTDNPLTLHTAGLLSAAPTAWYLMNDASSSGLINDSSGQDNPATPGKYSGPGLQYGGSGCPPQIPSYAGAASPPGMPNPTVNLGYIDWPLSSVTSPSGYIITPAVNWSGKTLTVSGWIAPDTATWGNTSSGSRAVLAANTTSYSGNGNGSGAALYLRNAGSRGNPSWVLTWYVNNNGTSQSCSASVPPTINSVYYVVATFSSGAMVLYVNGVSAATASAGFTTVPAGQYSPTIGMDPTISRDWFFGAMAGVWFSEGVLSSSGVTQVWNGTGGSSTEGGAGGGASGGPAANGGNGAAGSGSSGGAGGTAPAQPTTEIGITTPGSAGIAGAAGSSDNSGSGGSYGAGGGGAGNSSSPPNIVTITVPFSTAASYCGTDAAGGAGGVPYNPVIQGTNGRLFTGGLASDAASGSKNSLLILGSVAATAGNAITRVTLTFTNANTTATQSALLQVGWAPDTFLPATYTGADIAGSASVVEIPVGAYTVTADITESQIGTQIANGTATALVLGPGASPTFQAYSSTTAADFYTAVYGPGAVDSAGNSLAPYLTITYAQAGTGTLQQGSSGGSGGILITYVDQAQTLVGNFAAQAGTAVNGASYAQGLNATGGQTTGTTVVLGTTQGIAGPLGRLAARSGEHLGVRDGTSPTTTNGAVLGYNTSTTSVTQTTPGSYNFTVPAGVTSVNVACWGAGAGGTGGNRNYGAGGGGGGSYAGYNNYPVQGGQVIQYAVGAGGTGQTIGSGSEPDGGATGFDTTNVAGIGVTAFGGQAYRSSYGYGPGGGLSGAPVNFTGGNGGPQSFSSNGTGGGGSAGATSRGLGGSSNGGAGTAGSGGGEPGGAGGGSGAVGHAGTAPGGGGGGAGNGNSDVSGNGANGKIVITYLSSVSLGVSVATAAGTDAAGNAYPIGVLSPYVTLTGTGSSAVAGANTTGSQVVVDGGDGQTYSTQRNSLISTGASFSTSGGLTTILSQTVAARTYRISGKIYFSISAPGGGATMSTFISTPASTTGSVNYSVVRAAVFNFTFVGGVNTSITTGVLAVNSGYYLEIEGVLFIPSNGTLAVQVTSTTTSGAGSISSGTFIDILPVT